MRRFVAVLLVVSALSAAHARELQQTAAAAQTTSKRGTISIIGRPRDPLINQQLAGIAAAAAFTPEPLRGASTTNALAPAAAAVPAATATIKRIFFRNNCTCRNTKAYPVLAISYKPVAAADFLTVGYWSLQGCKDRYLIATAHATIGIWGKMEGGDTTWEGDVPLRVYVPAEDKCDIRKSFAGYDMPQDWNDYTVVLNCN